MRSVLSFVAVCVLAISTVRADEEKIPLDKLPKAVLDAVKAKFPKAELVSAEKETEDGKTVYEVAIKEGKTTAEIKLSEDGKILEIEREVDVKDLPKAIKDALEAKYPKAKHTGAEESIQGDKKNYEVALTTADGKTLKVTLDGAGKILETEEVKKEEKKKEVKKEEKK